MNGGLFKLVLLILLITGCSHFKAGYSKYVDQPDPPLCKNPVTYELGEVKKILIFGDGINGEKWREVLDQMKNHMPYDLALYMGDQYPYGLEDEAYFQKYVLPYFDLNTPVYFTLGNHEYLSEPKNLVKFTKKYHKFIFPCVEYGIRSKFIDMYTLDTNTAKESPNVNQMVDFFNGSSNWKLLFAHHPFKSNSKEKPREDEERNTRSLLLSAVQKAKINIYASGHDHHQEYQWTDGFHHIVQGAAGKALRDVEKVNHFIAKKYGFTILQIQKDMIQGTFYDIDGKILHIFQDWK